MDNSGDSLGYIDKGMCVMRELRYAFLAWKSLPFFIPTHIPAPLIITLSPHLKRAIVTYIILVIAILHNRMQPELYKEFPFVRSWFV